MMQRPSRPESSSSWFSLSIVLALLVHALLAIFLFFGLSWKNETPEAQEVELWAALPSASAPTPDPTTPPVPVQSPPPEPEPILQKDADIAIKTKPTTKPVIEKPLKLPPVDEQRKKEEEEKKKQIEVAKKAEEKKKADEKKKAEEKRKEQKLKEAFQQDIANLNTLESARIDGQDQTSRAGGAAGNSAYASKIRACIQPNVVYPVSGQGNPKVVFNVVLDTNGAQSKKPVLIESSGIEAFDRAVEVGILRCNPFPKPPNGAYPPSIRIEYALQN